MLSAINSFTSTAPAAIFIRVQPYINKVVIFAKEYFTIISNFCLVGLGFKELTFKTIQIAHAKAASNDFWKALWEGICDFKLVQGCLFVISGVLGGLAAAHYHGLLNLGSAAHILELAGNGLFIIGNLLALKGNIETFLQALKTIDSVDPQEKEAARNLMITSILGIINNLSYLFALGAALLGAPVALAFIFGGIGLLTGCVKIFIECFFPTTKVAEIPV